MGRGAVALTLAYALILQGIFYAMGAGLAASPASRLTHVLCTPGTTATQDVPSDPASLPECCVIGCAAVAVSLPAPEIAASTARPSRFATIRIDRSAEPIPVFSRSTYPLGARAPPVLS